MEATMKKYAVLSAAALIGMGSLAVAPDAEARPRRGAAVAAGVVGGLAAGALIGAAASSAYAHPSYSYGYPAHTYPAYSYDEGYEQEYVPARRTRRVVRTYEAAPDYEYAPAYRSRRVVRSHHYGYAPVSSGYSWGGRTHSGWYE
jgi:hypothetical protein